MRTAAILLLLSSSAFAQDAEALLEANELGLARTAAEKEVAADPDDGSAHGVLGQVLFRFCELEGAKAAFERARELAPGEWGSFASSYLAQIAFFRGEDEAVNALLPKLSKDDWVRESASFLMAPPAMTVRRSKKKRYLIYTDAAMAEGGGAAFASNMLDLIYDAYSKVFPWKTDPKLISRVYLFSDTAGFRRFNQTLGGGSDAVGFYHPSFRLLIVNADPDGEPVNEFGFSVDVIDTLFHEAFHQFLHLHVDEAPVWFDEGLADYFGPSRQKGKKKLAIGVVTRAGPTVTRFERIQEMVFGRDDAEPLPLREFIALTDETFRGGRELANYAQGWSVVHFLLHGAGKKGRKLLKGYFHAFKQGRTRAEAHGLTFDTVNLDKLEAGWREYVKRLEP